MIVFRLSRSKYARDLSGLGARVNGGRWNSKGIAVLYACESRALCTAEVAVHTPLGNIPLDYNLVSIEIPDDIKVKELSSHELPADWKSIPHSHSTQEKGDKFVKEGKFLLLKVPSVVVEGEFNFLINPEHKDMKRVKIKAVVPFNFDERLFVR